jgi:O-antigen/teichoic acid export membrane protein
VVEVTTPEADPAAAVPPGSRNVFKTLVGVLFMYGSRGFGLLLTLALIGKLGVADYGLYALAYTFSVILGPPIDNPWSVRAIRESDEEFARERASRYLLGATFMVTGAAFIPVSYFVWFGLIVAGGEMVFNVVKSQNARALGKLRHLLEESFDSVSR